MRKTFLRAGQVIKQVVILMLFCCLAVLSLFLCGCTETARVYPVEGPLMQQNVGVLYAKFLWDGSGSGWIKIVLPDGEICKGEYTTLVDGVSSF
ncbi:MAG: hypothetical protein ABSA76_12975, partial [Bacteroidales bacterium]